MDENEDGVYVGDYVVTLKVSFNSYEAFMLNPATNTILGADSNKKLLLQQRISFIINDYISHISLVIHRKNPINENEDDYYVQVRLNINSFQHIELRELSEQE